MTSELDDDYKSDCFLLIIKEIIVQTIFCSLVTQIAPFNVKLNRF